MTAPSSLATRVKVLIISVLGETFPLDERELNAAIAKLMGSVAKTYANRDFVQAAVDEQDRARAARP